MGKVSVQNRYDNIKKSPNDSRNYRGLVLNNQLKVLLINDAKAEKSAAALNVNVGYMSDPDDLPGLAHLCEHMLFMGTEKYPNVNEYIHYLTSHGGSSNANTYSDHTSFYFDVNHHHLEKALDQFAQFFISPLFLEFTLKKELNAINHEHEKNLKDEDWRLVQFDKYTADSTHPYSKFGTGNTETLETIPKENNIDVRVELLKFWETHYSANVMSLSILGRETLDELEEMAVNMFSNIKDKNVESPKWEEHPFKTEHFCSKWYIQSLLEYRQLRIVFPIPDLREHYRFAPLRYWTFLLDNERKGSLHAKFKELGWATTVSANKADPGRGFDFFEIYVFLTLKGLDHVDEIILMIFQYLNMVKKEGPVERIFSEYCDIADMEFRFKENYPAEDCVVSTATALQYYPINEILTATELYPEWRPDLVESVGQYLVPEKIRVHVLAPEFEKIVNRIEPFYGTKFKQETIPNDVIEDWKNAGLNIDFQLPPGNEFIPTDFKIKPLEKAGKYHPEIVRNTKVMRMWFKQDDEFLVPKASFTIDFISPLVYMDPLAVNLTFLYAELIKDALDEIAFQASMGGLTWVFGQSKHGLLLCLEGYNHKIFDLFKKILQKIVNTEINEAAFNLQKQKYFQGLNNFEVEQPYEQATYYLNCLLTEQVWTKDDLCKYESSVTLDRLHQFIPLMLSRLYAECFIHGNVTLSEALEISDVIESAILSIPNYTHLLPNHLMLWRQFFLPIDSRHRFEVKNRFHKSICTLVYYQVGIQSTENFMLLQLFGQVILEPCHNQLRNEQQLGYVVGCSVYNEDGALGLYILIQSNRHPQVLEDKIGDFMDSMETYIRKMTNARFNEIKESLANLRLDRPKELHTLAGMFFREIIKHEFNFDRDVYEVSFLRTITHHQLCDFYYKYFSKTSRSKSTLTIHVVPSDKSDFPQYEGSEEQDDVTPIVDVLNFKTSLELLPLTEPFGKFYRRGTRVENSDSS